MFGITVTHSSEYPGKIHPSTTAREQEVIVQFVGPGCGSVECGALDREHYRSVARIHENVASETVHWVLPSYWK